MTKDCLKLIPLFGAAFLFTSCGGGGNGDGPDNASDFPPYDNTEEVEAFYQARPERFVFASPEKLPADLKWENGMDLPEIGSEKAKKGGIMQGGLPDFPRTLRHVGPDSNGSFRPYVLDDMTLNWAHRHPDEEGYYPGIASEWSIDEENGTVYVKINPDARWSDGEAITTEDAIFPFYFRTSDYTNAPFGKNFFEEKYTNITIYDEHTFSVTVADKRPDFASYVLELAPTPRHFYLEHGPDFVQRYQWRFVPTSGPYVINPDDIRKGRSIALTRLDDWWAKERKYWKNRYNPDRIELTVVRDPAKSFESFKKGDFDIARLNLAEYWYEKLPDDDPLVKNGYVHKYTFYNEIPRGTLGLWLNTSKPPLDNVHVRHGIHHAANWNLVIEKFFRGDWERLRTTGDGYGEPSRSDIEPREFSVEKATAEFAKAGFTKRGPDGILMNDQGQRLSFTVTTGYKTFGDALTILKQEGLKAGIEFQIEILDSTAGWKKAQEKNHQIALTGTSSSPSEFYPRYWDFWHSDNALDNGKPKPQTNNFTITALPELDELIDRYEKSEDHTEKVGLAHQIEDILYEHAAWVPGVDMIFYRVGSWRWIEWPENFNVRRSEHERSYWVHWIDEEKRKETKEAMKAGKTFDPVIKVYDQYKPN
jgi:microcin C transport system substrate-binding protein